jgi:hypothetical protein
MGKVHKHNLINTKTPSSESYKNDIITAFRFLNESLVHEQILYYVLQIDLRIFIIN